MKILINIFLLASLTLFFVSCESDKKTEPTVQESSEKEVVQNLRKIKVDIKGMTCEIGCARLIQSKLYKADGITEAKISFEDSSGIVSFDQNQINQERIKEIIENTAGGDIYSVVSIHEVDETSHDKNIQ